ncbi:dnaJ homolog subfamily C member 11 isoform X1 [Anabrus simplex]|uniref:dnaJ homolog subfamily C member 11 isoform X1 n=1 Tax=Anabrus simplex TaxID=316456 RepID=UPI0034DD3516
MDDENEDGAVIEEDYYAFLNVSRNATNEEINNAYRRLSRLYHPDKHVDPVRKAEAEQLFSKTKKAYEVLSDPHQRAIYDSLGIRGLATEGWEIVQRTKTPQEIREEYENLARERAERRLQQRTNPKGNVTVNINATDIFSRYEDEFDFDESSGRYFPYIEVSGMSFSQSIEAPLTLRDTIIMSGQLSTHNGTGSGSLNVSARRLLSEKGWIECEIGAGSGPVMSVKGFRTLTKRIFVNMSTIFQFTPHGIRPGLITTLANQLDKNTVGYLTWRAGLQSSMSTIVVRDTPTSHMAFSIQFGIPHSYLSLSYTHKFEEWELKLRGAMKAGTFGAVLEYGAEKKVSQHSSVAAAVSLGVPSGIILRVKLSRASQTYSFPIHLSEEILPSPVFYATVTPILVWAIVKKLVIDPMVRDQKERDKEKQRETNKNRMAEKKREAQAAVNLMRATFARVRSDEEAKKGLVIVKALYGRLLTVASLSNPPASSEGEGEDAPAQQDEVIDVTIPLQCLVKDSKLVLHESSKSQLPGFYDPCMGEEKSLMVQYLYHNQLHEVTVGDTEPLRIPKQTHRVNPT